MASEPTWKSETEGAEKLEHCREESDAERGPAAVSDCPPGSCLLREVIAECTRHKVERRALQSGCLIAASQAEAETKQRPDAAFLATTASFERSTRPTAFVRQRCAYLIKRSTCCRFNSTVWPFCIRRTSTIEQFQQSHSCSRARVKGGRRRTPFSTNQS